MWARQLVAGREAQAVEVGGDTEQPSRMTRSSTKNSCRRASSTAWRARRSSAA
jgi:hypothetical protein